MRSDPPTAMAFPCHKREANHACALLIHYTTVIGVGKGSRPPRLPNRVGVFEGVIPTAQHFSLLLDSEVLCSRVVREAQLIVKSQFFENAI